MEIWDIVKMVSVLAIPAALFVGAIWAVVSRFKEISASMALIHDEELSYRLSREDRESLTQKELKMTRRMKNTELTAFLNKRFPNSVPERKTDLENL